ncbi:MAG: septum formation initiator family protein [Patescibacteria group bacterium]
MIEFQARKKLRDFLYSKITLAVLFIAFVFIAHSTYGLWLKNRETEKTLNVLKNELAELTAKENNLASRVEALGTDKGTEEVIREKFKVAKEGEGVIVVVDQKEEKRSDTLTGNWFSAFFRNVKNYFK